MKPNQKHNQVRGVLGMNDSNVKNVDYDSKYSDLHIFPNFLLFY